jgi:hypothetical protein
MGEELQLARDLIFKFVDLEQATWAGKTNFAVLVFLIVVAFAHLLLQHVGEFITRIVVTIFRIGKNGKFKTSDGSLIKTVVVMWCIPTPVCVFR